MLNYLQINIVNLIKNLHIIQQELDNKCILAPMLKENAYGLGIKKISSIMHDLKYDHFWVYDLQEAVELRKNLPNCHIYLLQNLQHKAEMKTAKQHNINHTVNDLCQLNNIIDHPKNLIIYFDTGMTREGIFPEDLDKINPKIMNNSLIISHLASADEHNSQQNIDQLTSFLRIKSHFPKAKYSLANSAGIFLGKNFHFDMVRPGGSIYGVKSCKRHDKTYNVVSFFAQILNRKILHKDLFIGYNATYKAKKGDKILIIHAGYAQGITRNLSNRHYGMFRNYKLPFIGRISMNTITLCGNNLPDNLFESIKYVELIGEKNTINDIANILEVDAREILTDISKVKHKMYIE